MPVTSAYRLAIIAFLRERGFNGELLTGIADDLELRLARKFAAVDDDDELRDLIDREFKKMTHLKELAPKKVQIDDKLLEGAFGAKPTMTARAAAIRAMSTAARELLGEDASEDDVKALANHSYAEAMASWGSSAKNLEPGASLKGPTPEALAQAKKVVREEDSEFRPQRNPFSPAYSVSGKDRIAEMQKVIKMAGTAKARAMAAAVSCTIMGLPMTKPPRQF